MGLRIGLGELRAMTATLLRHLETLKSDEVEIPHDYFWHIPAADKYDVAKEPSDLTVGQLSDDWAELQRIQKREVEPLGYALVWLSNVLRAIGESTVG
jgi:hypothetical protein